MIIAIPLARVMACQLPPPPAIPFRSGRVPSVQPNQNGFALIAKKRRDHPAHDLCRPRPENPSTVSAVRSLCDDSAGHARHATGLFLFPCLQHANRRLSPGNSPACVRPVLFHRGERSFPRHAPTPKPPGHPPAHPVENGRDGTAPHFCRTNTKPRKYHRIVGGRARFCAVKKRISQMPPVTVHGVEPPKNMGVFAIAAGERRENAAKCDGL